ncbi:MAG: DinB family protein [Planctomycetales bacterium]|nr:DinB family protein [Planctomycetales bacterium]
MEFKLLIDEYLSGPKRLRTAIQGMSPEQLDAAPIEGRWSTRQVICHIADFEPVYVDRMKRVIAEHEPMMFGGDPDEFAASLAYAERDLENELKLIEIIRVHMASILRTVPTEEFQRKGVHSQEGPLTLETLLRRITRHIFHHVKFIEEKRAAL